MSENPKSLREIFPGVQADRVKLLTADAKFKAVEALGTLYQQLTTKQKAGENVAELLTLLESAYTPSVQSLQAEIHESGYSSAEVSAAMLVSRGEIVL